MSRRIDNVATGADFTAAATVEQPDTVRVNVTVDGNPVAYQEGECYPPIYGGEARYLKAGGYSFQVQIGGIRFRDWTAGLHGTVTCTLLSKYDLPESPAPIPRVGRRPDELTPDPLGTRLWKALRG